MSVHRICDGKPDVMALLIALMSEFVGFFSSQIGRPGPMVRLHVTGVHQNRFFLSWKPHSTYPITCDYFGYEQNDGKKVRKCSEILCVSIV